MVSFRWSTRSETERIYLLGHYRQAWIHAVSSLLTSSMFMIQKHVCAQAGRRQGRTVLALLHWLTMQVPIVQRSLCVLHRASVHSRFFKTSKVKSLWQCKAVISYARGALTEALAHILRTDGGNAFQNGAHSIGESDNCQVSWSGI